MQRLFLKRFSARCNLPERAVMRERFSGFCTKFVWILVQSAENNSGFCTIFRSNMVQSAEVHLCKNELFCIVTAVGDT